MNFDEAVSAIEEQSELYRDLLQTFSDTDFRDKADFFGRYESKGAHIVSLVVSGHAAYRTQLFLYLRACGREELNTMNLWGGMDGPMS
jgi:hypothetical protein